MTKDNAMSEELKRLNDKLSKHDAAWNDILALLEDAPEINPSNYDHDQVCLLNNQMVQAWNLASKMLEAGSD